MKADTPINDGLISNGMADRLDGLSLHPTVLQQSGLEHAIWQSAQLEMRELTNTSLLRLHSLQPEPDLQQALRTHDLELPLEVGQCTGRDPVVLCLRPAEWLLFSEFLDVSRLSDKVASLLDARSSALLDLSASQVIFRLSGAAAPWLLQKLTGLDLFAPEPKAAYCARTRLQHVAACLHYHLPCGHHTEFVHDLIIDRSLARYTWDLLLASAPHAQELSLEYGENP